MEGKGPIYTIDLLKAVELSHMLHIAKVMYQGALYRQESRGPHYRADSAKGDASTWLRHTLARRDGDNLLMDYESVTFTPFEPIERSY